MYGQFQPMNFASYIAGSCANVDDDVSASASVDNHQIVSYDTHHLDDGVGVEDVETDPIYVTAATASASDLATVKRVDDASQLTFSFRRQVYVFDAITPDKEIWLLDREKLFLWMKYPLDFIVRRFCVSVSDRSGMQTSRVIIGLCLDMCPVSWRSSYPITYERAVQLTAASLLICFKYCFNFQSRKRQREKENVILTSTNGDRNQTSESLVVKKVMIRAIRMDLRMQHIFDQGAITMLEQMLDYGEEDSSILTPLTVF
ncbi:hypothetical protein CRYUN_Cryun23aG0047200 [Craigia yunnanensis]